MSFSTYELKFNRMHASTATAFIQFERCLDHLEFIHLMDQQVFLGLKLKVMPFGFTNVDRQESLNKPQLWQDSACKLFNTQWYPKEELNNTSTNNASNEQVYMPSNRYFSKSTKRELSLNSLSENSSVEKK